MNMQEAYFDVNYEQSLVVMGGKASLLISRLLSEIGQESELGQFNITAAVQEEENHLGESNRRNLGITSNQNFGWIYVMNMTNCQMISFDGYAGLTNGIKAIHANTQETNDPVAKYAFVGYDGTNQEFIYYSDWSTSVAYPNSESDTVLPSGIDWHGDLLIVAGESYIKLINKNDATCRRI